MFRAQNGQAWIAHQLHEVRVPICLGASVARGDLAQADLQLIVFLLAEQPIGRFRHEEQIGYDEGEVGRDDPFESEPIADEVGEESDDGFAECETHRSGVAGETRVRRGGQLHHQEKDHGVGVNAGE